MHVHLGGRQADARGGVHGLEHIGDQLLERGIEAAYRLGAGPQPRIGKLQYGQ